MNKTNVKSDYRIEISKFVYKSVVDFSEIISDNPETQETIQITLFAVTGAIGGILFYSRVKEKDQGSYRTTNHR